MTPLHQAAWGGHTDVIKVLVEAGASLSAVDNDVIKPSVKLIQSNIKLFKCKQHNFILQKYFINNSVVIT
jgi:ankyrin repeat protein